MSGVVHGCSVTMNNNSVWEDRKRTIRLETYLECNLIILKMMSA